MAGGTALPNLVSAARWPQNHACRQSIHLPLSPPPGFAHTDTGGLGTLPQDETTQRAGSTTETWAEKVVWEFFCSRFARYIGLRSQFGRSARDTRWSQGHYPLETPARVVAEIVELHR